MSEATPAPEAPAAPESAAAEKTYTLAEVNAAAAAARKSDAAELKAGREAAAKLADIEAAALSEAQKAEKRIAEMEKRIADGEAARVAAELASMRARIGAAKNVPAGLIDRLVGDDEASISADAEKVLADIAGTKKNGNRVPHEGATPSAPKSNDAAFARNLFGGGE
jgi:hypothetical protein